MPTRLWRLWIPDAEALAAVAQTPATVQAEGQAQQRNMEAIASDAEMVALWLDGPHTRRTYRRANAQFLSWMV